MRSLRNNTRYSTLLGAMLLATLLLLAACGSATSASGGSSSTGTTVTATPDKTHTSLAQLVGNPTAKATTGTSFEVTGQVKNLDTKQHDIYVQATLTDANGKIVGTSEPTNADNVHAGDTDTYTIKGTLTQPTWTNVSVKIVKVTENVNGSGND